MEHAEFDALLRQRHNERVSPPRNVRLPSQAGIRVGGDLDRVTLFLSEKAVCANMQTDAAAFEAWAAVLMAWCTVRRIAVDWHEPADPRDGHYQRFLYRLASNSSLTLTVQRSWTMFASTTAWTCLWCASMSTSSVWSLMDTCCGISEQVRVAVVRRGSDPGYTRNVESLGWRGSSHF